MNIELLKQTMGAAFIATLLNACGGGGEQVTLKKYTVHQTPFEQKEFYENGKPRQITEMAFLGDRLYIAVKNRGLWQGKPGEKFTQVEEVSKNIYGAGPKDAIPRVEVEINGEDVEVDNITRIKSYPDLGWLVAQSQMGFTIIDKNNKVWGTISHALAVNETITDASGTKWEIREIPKGNMSEDFALIKGQGDHEFLVSLEGELQTLQLRQDGSHAVDLSGNLIQKNFGGNVRIYDLSDLGNGNRLRDSAGHDTQGEFLAIHGQDLVVIGEKYDLRFTKEQIKLDGRSSSQNGKEAVLDRSKIGALVIPDKNDPEKKNKVVEFLSLPPSGVFMLRFIEDTIKQEKLVPVGFYTWLPDGTYKSPLVGPNLVDAANALILKISNDKHNRPVISVHGEDMLITGLLDNSIYLYRVGEKPVVFGNNQSLKHRFSAHAAKPSSGFANTMPYQAISAAAKFGNAIYYIGEALGELSLNTITIEDVVVTRSK